MGTQIGTKNQFEAGRAVNWYQAIMDSIIDAMVILNDEGTIIASNPAVERLFGYPAAETNDQAIGFLVPDLRTGNEDGPGQFFAPVGIDHEHDGARKDGSTFPLRMDLSEFIYGDNSFYVVLMRDDTANKMNEAMYEETLSEAVRGLEDEKEESDRRRSEIRAIIDTSVDAIAVVQPDGTFAYVDNRFTEFFGIDQGGIEKRKWAEMIPFFGRVFENPAEVFELVTGTAADDELEIQEIVTQQLPQFRELDLRSRPVMTKGGHFLGRLYVFRDITHEREVDRMKTQFVSMVSH